MAHSGTTHTSRSPLAEAEDEWRPIESSQIDLLSHDLRSALSDITGGLGFIDSDLLPESQAAQLERARSAARSLNAMLDEYLEAASLVRLDGTPHRPESFELEAFLKEIVSRWKGRASEKGLKFEVSQEGELPHVIRTERAALDRILGNFLSNAIKHTAHGAVKLTVSLEPGGPLVFRINDQGPGLSAEARARLFEPHGRPDDSDIPGEGLGLYITRQLAKRIGGEVKLENDEKGGTRATLTIPREQWRTDRGSSRGSPISALPDLKGLKVLVAEDNATNQLVVTQMLETLGAEHALAADGIEALECIRREAFDFALLDIEMPRMSGLELIRTIRQMSGPVSEMPLIAFTAYVMPEHRKRILEAGADGIIAKPLTSIAEFGAAILEYIEGRTPVGNPLTAGAGNRRRQSRGSAKGIHLAANPEKSPNELAVASEGLAARDHGAPIADPGDLSEEPQISPAPLDKRAFESLVQSVGPETAPLLLEKLEEDLKACKATLGKALTEGDVQEIRAQTHILMSLAGAVGAHETQTLARELNGAAHKEDSFSIQEKGHQILEKLNALHSFISDRAAHLPAR